MQGREKKGEIHSFFEKGNGMITSKKNVEILDSLEIAEKLNVGVRYVVLECKKCHRHFGITVNCNKISEEDMICRNCKK